MCEFFVFFFKQHSRTVRCTEYCPDIKPACDRVNASRLVPPATGPNLRWWTVPTTDDRQRQRPAADGWRRWGDHDRIPCPTRRHTTVLCPEPRSRSAEAGESDPIERQRIADASSGSCRKKHRVSAAEPAARRGIRNDRDAQASGRLLHERICQLPIISWRWSRRR